MYNKNYCYCIHAGPVDHRPKGETEDFAVLPSPSYVGAFRSAKNIVSNNRKIHVDRSDERCHENGMDMPACVCYRYELDIVWEVSM